MRIFIANLATETNTFSPANFDALRRTAADPAAHRAFLMRSSLLESVRRTSGPMPAR